MMQRNMGSQTLAAASVLLALCFSGASNAFSPSTAGTTNAKNAGGSPTFAGSRSADQRRRILLASTTATPEQQQQNQESTATTSFIQTELRGAAMKLHTRQQAPREGQAAVVEDAQAQQQQERYTPTHADYLAFLVDSHHVYQALEEIVRERSELEPFRNTGLERVRALELDIAFLVQEYGLDRPRVGKPGTAYADHLRRIESMPEFVCHYYNFYFAHTAGGRMIGKRMSALLLDRKTLEFYKVRSLGGCRMLVLLDVIFCLFYLPLLATSKNIFACN
jgi:heme oxygenase (biliverdin-producing, ferredoxin)